MVTFANDQRHEGKDAREAAWLAGITRLRPVMMTALAMIIGMLPMSLGLGEGGEQNAPLGRAVIGGLSLATIATLIFVPVVYSALRTKPPAPPVPGRRGMMSTNTPVSHRSRRGLRPGRASSERSRNLTIVVSVFVLFLAGLLGAGLVPRLLHKKDLAADVERAQASTSRVQVVKPTRGQVGQVTLPSSVEPLRETVVYARTNGYVHKWNVDIGDSVKAGQVMATIDTPEVDQELRATEASYQQSEALVVVEAKARRGAGREDHHRRATTRCSPRASSPSRTPKIATRPSRCRPRTSSPRKPPSPARRRTCIACASSRASPPWSRPSTAWSRRAPPKTVSW